MGQGRVRITGTKALLLTHRTKVDGEPRKGVLSRLC
jgi:hypothetical protein